VDLDETGPREVVQRPDHVGLGDSRSHGQLAHGAASVHEHEHTPLLGADVDVARAVRSLLDHPGNGTGTRQHHLHLGALLQTAFDVAHQLLDIEGDLRLGVLGSRLPRELAGLPAHELVGRLLDLGAYGQLEVIAGHRLGFEEHPAEPLAGGRLRVEALSQLGGSDLPGSDELLSEARARELGLRIDDIAGGKDDPSGAGLPRDVEDPALPGERQHPEDLRKGEVVKRSPKHVPFLSHISLADARDNSFRAVAWASARKGG
jgi:hypothetical protein